MCGIAGIISFRQGLLSGQRVKAMTNSLAHRGPDGEGYWTNPAGTINLGHRRLSIIDLSANAAQPMHYLQRYTIVYNGEIYNYIEIKKLLTSKGYKFFSQSDTEVILAAYDCWKNDCLPYFDGMFALAIWDEQEQTLFAARDRFGEKPFFYCLHEGELFFASEMKALWAAGIDRKLNERLAYNFITLGYTQNPADPTETACQQIYKLPAASFFTYRGNAVITLQNYWKVEKNIGTAISPQHAIEKFTALFQESVRKRLRSDVTLGTSLSGGLDSSSIATTIKQLQPAGSLQTFSAIFPGSNVDESYYSKLVAIQTGFNNCTIEPTAEGFVLDFDKLCYQHEGFISSASVYAQYKVFELAKQQQVKVLLDGQGADEILAGYHKYYHWFWQQLYRTDKAALQHELNATSTPFEKRGWNWKNKLAATLPAYAGAFVKRAKKRVQTQSGGLTNAFTNAYGTSYYELPGQDSLNNVLHYNTFSNGLEELLQYADRNSMAHGREVRLPFLQHELVEFVFALPASFKIRDGWTKWILRKSMENNLPAAIAWRKDKIGFEPPQKTWMQNLKVQEYIRAAKQKLVDQKILKKQMLYKKIQPQDSPAADNFDWRYLSVAKWL